MERRLHIGGRERRDGWEIIDVKPGPAVVHVGDAVDLSRFADSCLAAHGLFADTSNLVSAGTRVSLTIEAASAALPATVAPDAAAAPAQAAVAARAVGAARAARTDPPVVP